MNQVTVLHTYFKTNEVPETIIKRPRIYKPKTFLMGSTNKDKLN